MTSLQDGIRTWNIAIQSWLKYYVFFRLMDRSKKGSTFWPMLITNLVSALWHGPEPGYAMFFAALMMIDLGQK
jgi:D-alanyl-lipoteichoic acid acyltransferase DltB (MBOAT superfamily)